MTLVKIIKSRYENGDKKLIHAMVCDTPDEYIKYIYDMLVLEFDQPFGQATREVAKELYEEEMCPYLTTLKLFEPLLK